ncbi:Uncharacterised protein [Escherichia coli]|nr:Uncharacterised protein [Escherichia coli]
MPDTKVMQFSSAVPGVRPRLTSYITLQPCPNIPSVRSSRLLYTRCQSSGKWPGRLKSKSSSSARYLAPVAALTGCGRALMAFCVITPIPTLAAKQAILESILPGRRNISATVATRVICDLPLLISLTTSNGPPMRTSGDTNAPFPGSFTTLASQVQRAPLRTAGWLLIRTSRAPSAIYSAAGGSSSPLNRLLMLPITAFTP